jgi:Fe-S oxidoreductase
MSQANIKQKRLDWIPEDIEVNRQSDTAFFVGCSPYFDAIFQDIDVKPTEGTNGALKLLNHAHLPFTLLNNERCCGRDLLLLGDVDGFSALAQANMSEFSNMGIKNIITSCPECYYTLKIDYPRVIEAWNINVMHLTEVIAPLVASGKLTLGRIDQKITYHDPCTLGRYSKIFDQPRSILTSIEGIELVEMDENRDKALCCGASPWAYCSMVHKQIQKERLGQAGDTGADVMVTACPKCLIHLKCAQKNAENNGVCKIEIQDMFHLVAQSLMQEKSS